MCVDICADMCMDVCMDMGTDMGADTGMDMSISRTESFLKARDPERNLAKVRLLRHACRHVYRLVYGHTHRQGPILPEGVY